MEPSKPAPKKHTRASSNRWAETSRASLNSVVTTSGLPHPETGVLAGPKSLMDSSLKSRGEKFISKNYLKPNINL
jgi:hypothetical protein